MTDRRVVITGMGALSPLGLDAQSTWEGMKEGRSGIDILTLVNPDDYPVKIAGEVKGFDAKPFFQNPKDARRADRYAQLAMAASKMAIEESGIAEAGYDPAMVGVMVGSGIGGLGTLEREHRNLMNKGNAKVSPFTIPMMISNKGRPEIGNIGLGKSSVSGRSLVPKPPAIMTPVRFGNGSR